MCAASCGDGCVRLPAQDGGDCAVVHLRQRDLGCGCAGERRIPGAASESWLECSDMRSAFGLPAWLGKTSRTPAWGDGRSGGCRFHLFACSLFSATSVRAVSYGVFGVDSASLGTVQKALSKPAVEAFRKWRTCFCRISPSGDFLRSIPHRLHYLPHSYNHLICRQLCQRFPLKLCSFSPEMKPSSTG